jgi:hypothetical protein
MSTSCADPLTAERLIEYLLGELEAADEERVEGHIFACARCAAAAEILAGLAAAVRRTIPQVLTRSRFESLDGAGMVSQQKVMAPGDVAEVKYPPSGRLLVLRLAGADLGHAGRIDLELRTPEGATIGRLDDVPFDARRGELIVACQRHFAERFPADVVFGLDVVSGEERRRVAEYTVLHRLA